MADVLLLAALAVMTRLAEEGCCTALLSQFAYTWSRNFYLLCTYPELMSDYGGVCILHLP
jgi:hypothetical protein